MSQIRNVVLPLVWLALSYTGVVHAQINTPLEVKTGLWESSAAMPVPGSSPVEVFKDRRGCITAADLAKGWLGHGTDSTEKIKCTVTLIRSSAARQQSRAECKIAGLDRTQITDVEVQRKDSEHLGMTMKSPGPAGTTITIVVESKWVGAVCGSVRPK